MSRQGLVVEGGSVCGDGVCRHRGGDSRSFPNFTSDDAKCDYARECGIIE
jgi:hypothetical protein